MKFTVIDFETTGLGPLDEIITGFFVTFNRNGETIDELDVKLKPTRWSIEAEAIHKIPRTVANKFPDRLIGLREIAKYIKKHNDSIYICHANHRNGKTVGYFDWEMLRCNFFQAGDNAHWYFSKLAHQIIIISTHTIAKNKISLEKYRLSDLAFHYGFQFNHHNAKEDAMVTKKIFERLIDIKKITMDELINVGRHDKITQAKKLPNKGPRSFEGGLC